MQRRALIICLCLILAAAGVVGYFLIQSQIPDVPEAAVWEPRTQHPPVATQHTVSPYEQVAEPEPQDESEPADARGYTNDEREYSGSPDEPEPPAPPPEPPTLLPRVAELRERYNNNDIVGFIEIPNTNISYPVVQSGNNVFYLYHDLNRNPSRAGSIFLDYENNIYELADDNTIIYGHNMRDGSMFHNIRHFHNESFFRDHTYILLDTPYRQTVWDIFAFFHTTIDFCYLTTNFFDEEAFYEFMLLLQSMSRWDTDIVISPENQILILSTCGVQSGPNRYVVVSRLRVPELG